MGLFVGTEVSDFLKKSCQKIMSYLGIAFTEQCKLWKTTVKF